MWTGFGNMHEHCSLIEALKVREIQTTIYYTIDAYRSGSKAESCTETKI